MVLRKKRLILDEWKMNVVKKAIQVGLPFCNSAVKVGSAYKTQVSKDRVGW